MSDTLVDHDWLGSVMDGERPGTEVLVIRKGRFGPPTNSRSSTCNRLREVQLELLALNWIYCKKDNLRTNETQFVLTRTFCLVGLELGVIDIEAEDLLFSSPQLATNRND